MRPALETAPAGPAEDLRLAWNGLEAAPRSLQSWEVLLAADRPDRLALRFIDRRPLFTDPHADELPAPDTPVALRLGGENIFEGVVERLVVEDAPGEGPTAELVARAAYHFLREDPPARSYYRMTPGEIAAANALDLGLAPGIDQQGEPIAALERRGDPLEFLRGLSREAGFGLAIASGTLHFRRSLTGLGRLHRIEPDSGLLRLRFERRRRSRALAVLELARSRARLLLGIRPLDLLLLRGFGSGRDGDYRVLRVRLDGQAAGGRIRLELSSEGPAAEVLGPPGTGEQRS